MNNLICQKTVYIPDISISAHINPFVPNAPFLYPLKTSENLNVFPMFSESRERVHWEQMGYKIEQE